MKRDLCTRITRDFNAQKETYFSRNPAPTYVSYWQKIHSCISCAKGSLFIVAFLLLERCNSSPPPLAGATRKPSCNPAGVEPVHWKLAHIEPGSRLSGTNQEWTLALSSVFSLYRGRKPASEKLLGRSRRDATIKRASSFCRREATKLLHLLCKRMSLL